MKARREVKVALDKKDKALERKARNKVHKFKVKVRRTIMRKAKMGGGMMMKRPGMKKGSIPPQLKKYVMAKKKKAKMKKKKA